MLIFKDGYKKIFINIKVLEYKNFITGETTPNTIMDIITEHSKKLKKCKPRPKKAPKCASSKYGCCPDNKTAATGPFDEGEYFFLISCVKRMEQIKNIKNPDTHILFIYISVVSCKRYNK